MHVQTRRDPEAGRRRGVVQRRVVVHHRVRRVVVRREHRHDRRRVVHRGVDRRVAHRRVDQRRVVRVRIRVVVVHDRRRPVGPVVRVGVAEAVVHVRRPRVIAEAERHAPTVRPIPVIVVVVPAVVAAVPAMVDRPMPAMVARIAVAPAAVTPAAAVAPPTVVEVMTVPVGPTVPPRHENVVRTSRAARQLAAGVAGEARAAGRITAVDPAPRHRPAGPQHRTGPAPVDRLPQPRRPRHRSAQVRPAADRQGIRGRRVAWPAAVIDPRPTHSCRAPARALERPADRAIPANAIESAWASFDRRAPRQAVRSIRRPRPPADLRGSRNPAARPGTVPGNAVARAGHRALGAASDRTAGPPAVQRSSRHAVRPDG